MIIEAAHRFPQSPNYRQPYPDGMSEEHVRSAEAELHDHQNRRAALAPVEDIDRNSAIARIRAGLKARTGRAWSVTGGRGTAWGWITIRSLPARRGEFGRMAEEDRAILKDAMGLERVHSDGISIPASRDYYIEHVDRAEGREPRRIGTPYWD